MTLDLDKLEALDKAATAGPWRDVKRETPHHRYCEDPLYYVKHATGDGSLVNVCEAISFARPEQDAALIAEMRTQLPALLQAARERDEAVRLLRALLNENCVATRTDGWALIDRIASVKP